MQRRISEHPEKRIKKRNVKCWYACSGLMVDVIDSRLGGLKSEIRETKSDTLHSFVFFIVKYN